MIDDAKRALRWFVFGSEGAFELAFADVLDIVFGGALVLVFDDALVLASDGALLFAIEGLAACSCREHPAVTRSRQPSKIRSAFMTILGEKSDVESRQFTVLGPLYIRFLLLKSVAVGC